MDCKTKTIMLCGVGGQGTILAADVLAHVALAGGYDVKVSEIHGMSQRCGSVTTIVRYGEAVQSMVADLGEVDVIVAFEITEAMRNMQFLKEDGALVVNEEIIDPLPVLSGRSAMPATLNEDIRRTGALFVSATKLALEAGNAKTGNVVLIGALAATLDFPFSLWQDAVALRVPPKTVEVNLRALQKGYDLMTSSLQTTT